MIFWVPPNWSDKVDLIMTVAIRLNEINPPMTKNTCRCVNWLLNDGMVLICDRRKSNRGRVFVAAPQRLAKDILK